MAKSPTEHFRTSGEHTSRPCLARPGGARGTSILGFDYFAFFFKIDHLVKKLTIWSKIDHLVKNRPSGQKLTIWSKIGFDDKISRSI
jgi:hypothetical protein